MSSTTISVSDAEHGSGRDADDAIGLVILWSRAQPERIGEVALFSGSGAMTLGRGPGGAHDRRVIFYRQRPGDLTACPPLEDAGISRRQLSLRARDGAILLERVGRLEVFVNGEAVERTALAPGDTVHLKRQLLLLCVSRPAVFPAPRVQEPGARGEFGMQDAAGIVGESPAVWRLREQIAFAARAPGHVLVTGPSGSGKELAARGVHALSPRSAKAFVARNAATFPSELIDAELFGNMRGFPNPGMPERAGLVGEANGGTLFLDEIGDLPERLQAHLLRMLDRGGEYQRLGDSTTRRSDLRVVAATNRPLQTLRPELLARFSLRVTLPDLAERLEDIPLLVRHLGAKAVSEAPSLVRPFVDHQGRLRVDAALIEHLVRPGVAANIRALETLVWAAIETSEGDHLYPTDGVRSALATPREETPASAPSGHEPTPDEIRASVERHQGNLSRVARDLGLSSRFVLYRLLKKHAIEVESLRR